MGLQLPTYEQVNELPREVEPIIVPESFIDENGHMNIRHYYDLGAQAISKVFEEMGITDDYRAQRHEGFFTAEHHVRYFSEIKQGESVACYFQALERSDKVLHGMAFIVNESQRQLAATLEFNAVHVNLDKRRAQAFAEDIAETIDSVLGRTAHVTWSAPVCGVMGVHLRS